MNRIPTIGVISLKRLGAPDNFGSTVLLTLGLSMQKDSWIEVHKFQKLSCPLTRRPVSKVRHFDETNNKATLGIRSRRFGSRRTSLSKAVNANVIFTEEEDFTGTNEEWLRWFPANPLARQGGAKLVKSGMTVLTR